MMQLLSPKSEHSFWGTVGQTSFGEEVGGANVLVVGVAVAEYAEVLVACVVGFVVSEFSREDTWVVSIVLREAR
jgi:hypothetical protein